jgi:hypothetical protein
MRFVYYMIVVLVLLAAVPAFAAPTKPPKSTSDPDTNPSGVITLEQLTKELQYLTAQKEGIVVNFILPKNWEVVEEGIDAKTGKVREDLNVYSLLSRRPVADPKDPTDFIFELDIYKHGLTEGGQTNPKTGKPSTPADQFKEFLDVQMGINIKGGLKVTSKPGEIVPHEYGPKNRPKTIFVPVFYETPSGAMFYTFTSVAGDKIWQMKFLVSKDQTENYGALIALILDNSFGMTEAEFQELLKNTANNQPKPDAPK